MQLIKAKLQIYWEEGTLLCWHLHAIQIVIQVGLSALYQKTVLRKRLFAMSTRHSCYVLATHKQAL